VNKNLFALIVTAFICILTAVVVLADEQPVQKLADVNKIFVAQLGTVRGAELIRQKILNQLTESGHIVVVDTSDEADATFSGVAQLHRYGLYDDLVTSGEAVVRLVGKNKQILWTDDVAINKFPGYSSARKLSSRIADQLVKNLVNAIELDKSK
jgi:hypothetical protein